MLTSKTVPLLLAAIVLVAPTVARAASTVIIDGTGDGGGNEPSVGSVGDSYDNALAETILGLYKTELIRKQGPWRSLEDVEYGTLGRSR